MKITSGLVVPVWLLAAGAVALSFPPLGITVDLLLWFIIVFVVPCLLTIILVYGPAWTKRWRHTLARVGRDEGLMRDWSKRWASISQARAEAEESASMQQAAPVSGLYASLHKYLEHRFANVVVLEFGQIEDLLGFALPDLARTQQEWWTRTGTGKSPHSDAWRLAGRTARPNLSAKTVLFERVLGLRQRSSS